MASRKRDSMIGYVPKPVNADDRIIFFLIDIIRYNAQRDSVECLYGGGFGYSGEKVGNATLVMDKETREPLYFSGYREGSDFCTGNNEKKIVEECRKVANAIWG